MCGRFTLRTPASELIRLFSLLNQPDLFPRYNIAPTQPVACVRQNDKAERTLSDLRWGLVPFWAKDLKIGARMINARGETVATKPSFRTAFKKRRCLIPVDGFYEWKRLGPKQKQPYLIEMKSRHPFALAGLWEEWSPQDDPQATSVESCSIITTAANELMSSLHDRMPVIVDESDFDKWLDPRSKPVELESLIKPYTSQPMQVRAVSRVVNNARNEIPECVVPLDESE
jgi:putative SOS response-associated peptidase YedK